MLSRKSAFNLRRLWRKRIINDKPTFQPVIFGKYLLLEKIGSGGMAEIYRAKTFGPHGFKKEFAIKKILPNLSTDANFVSMFIDEAKLAVSLNHNNIIQVLDLGEIGQQYFIAMEYVLGKDLHELLAHCVRQKLRIPLKLALFIIMETLKGLDYAHRAKDQQGEPLKLVHCDVSPSNILLSYEGSVQVGDFGVARAATQQRGRLEALKGKIGYMSPEQVGQQALDQRSDLFACGIVLYEMLALRRLFAGNNDLSTMLKIRDGNIHRQMKFLKDYPKELKAIVIRALSSNKEDRYQRATEFYHDVIDFAFKHNIKVTDGDLSQYMKRVFHEEYEAQQSTRQTDPHSPAEFPDLLSPEVARWRYREPNGNIIGPMSKDTLMSLLVHQAIGCAVSQDYGPWCHPSELGEELQEDVSWLLDPSQDLTRETPTTQRAVHETPARSALERLIETSPPSKSAQWRAQASGRPPDMEGSLEELPFARLLYMLSARQVTGRLYVANGDIEKTITLQQGSPGYVASTKPNELLGRFLREQKVLSQAQLLDVLARLGEFGGRLGDILRAEDLLSDNELFHYLSLQAREKLLQVFEWTSGKFRYTAGADFGQETYPLGINTLEIIMQGIRTRTSDTLIQSFLNGRRHQNIQFLTNKHIGLDSVPLSQSELRVTVKLKNKTTLMALQESDDTDALKNDIARVCFMLYATGLIAFSDDNLNN